MKNSLPVAAGPPPLSREFEASASDVALIFKGGYRLRLTPERKVPPTGDLDFSAQGPGATSTGQAVSRVDRRFQNSLLDLFRSAVSAVRRQRAGSRDAAVTWSVTQAARHEGRMLPVLRQVLKKIR